MGAELERGTFGRSTISYLRIAAADFDFIEGAMVLILAVIGTGGHGAADAGVGVFGMIHLSLPSFVWYGLSMCPSCALIQTSAQFQRHPPGDPPGPGE